MGNNIYSVEYIISYMKNMFSQDILLRSVYVRGEVSNVSYHPSGHIYFSIKDKAGSLACIMFSGKKAAGLKFTLKEGQQVICFGTMTVFGPQSRYQMQVSSVTLDGEGLLYEKYEKLKKELEEMGYFAAEYKKPIPKYAKKVGIVTAKTGAAIQDIINISKRRNPYVQLYLYPAIVQGDGAASSIVNGIRALDKYGVDVIIVGRGGGSIEDLWAFNEEIVAKAIFECNTPIVSAVGHETDTTIADYVSDLRAPTPSAAAELTVFSLSELMDKIRDTEYLLRHKITTRLNAEKLKYDKAKLMVDKLNPVYELDNKRMKLIHIEERLMELMNQIMSEKKHTYELLIEQMKGLSPLEKLSKGFAFAELDEKPLKTVEGVKAGDEIKLYVKDGKIIANVKEVNKSV